MCIRDRAHNVALSLNKSVFEATAQTLASKGEPLGFVEVGMTDIATLPKELKLGEE